MKIFLVGTLLVLWIVVWPAWEYRTYRRKRQEGRPPARNFQEYRQQALADSVAAYDATCERLARRFRRGRES